MSLQAVIGLLTLTSVQVICQNFPPGFQFGAATAAYQVEGAWNVSDKGESVWDRLVHTRPELISDASTGDVACDSYHLLEEDFRIIEELELDFYRFSISWPRLLPSGFSNKISSDGHRYYSDLITGLRARGIAPIVTLFHWELPQSLQDLGGWTNPLIVDWFADYARVVFTLFSHQVKTWITINEPIAMCDSGYGGTLAPALEDPENAALLCVKYILLAHGAAYRIYDEEFKPKYGGEVSFSDQVFWYEPETNEDMEITQLAREYVFGRYSHPIYSAEGGWPPALEKVVAEKSREQGYPRSRLPAFTHEEIQLLKGSFDFYALNHYTSRTVRSARPGEKFGAYLMDGVEEIGAVMGSRPHWGTAESDWLKVNPEGIRHLLNLIKEQYGDIRILITENGYSGSGEDLNDIDRVKYYKDYLEQVLLAITVDKVNVVGYTAWSLMDNFEWMDGYHALMAAVPAERRFPDSFKFGAATAAYQIEGGWNASDKGESIWDHITHTNPAAISDLSNGDVACDSYHLWQDDIQLIKSLNLDFYRFSISWPRVLPTGFTNQVSDDGVRYYGNIIDGLLEQGIEPIVTLYHWDLPQPLQELGGWTNPLISDWFADYAKVIYDLYGDRVKTWMTINEPVAVCDLGYGKVLAPGIDSEGRGSYICSKNVLVAHAKAYRLYEREYKPKYNGRVSLANQLFWFEPETDETELTELALDITLGRYSHPIYSAEGGWPPALERYIAEKSEKEGEPRSRLPPFTKEEIELIRGSYDYYGLNHYTTRTVRLAAPGESPGIFLFQGITELDVVLRGRPGWTQATSSWFLVYPEGFRKLLAYVKQQYGDVEILISENGFSDTGTALDDQPRVDYYREYLAQLLLAIEEDKVNVIGYTAWSLMDNFEWMDGYQSRFGLHHVDFTSPARTRTPRRSAHYYAQVARTHDIDAKYDFDTKLEL